MATLPIANTTDKRIGLGSALTLLLLVFAILRWFLSYDIPNPLPQEKKVNTVANFEELDMKELVVEGGAGGGTPKDAPIDEPKPQTTQTLTQTNKPRPTTTNTGQSTTTNSPNSSNPSTTTQTSNNPFGDGGSGSGSGGGTGPGVGTTDGSSGTGPGAGVGNGKGRKAIGTLNVDDIIIETNAKIVFKLTVDSDGNVTNFSHYSAETTTVDQILINKIGNAIKRQIKFTPSPGSSLDYIKYPVNVKAT